jgi:hypothetical protein
VRLVADANVLLAAVLGGRARAVLQHPEIEELLTAEVTFAEVPRLRGHFGKKETLVTRYIALGHGHFARCRCRGGPRYLRPAN